MNLSPRLKARLWLLLDAHDRLARAVARFGLEDEITKETIRIAYDMHRNFGWHFGAGLTQYVLRRAEKIGCEWSPFELR